MKHRMLRVNEVVKRELSGIVAREISFEGALVTINHVKVNPDLKSAHVFVSVLGSEKAEDVMTRLEKHRVAFQSELPRRVTMKYTPHLLFHLDESISRRPPGVETLQQIDSHSEKREGPQKSSR